MGQIRVAYDSCTAANGTPFGSDKPTAPPSRIPDLLFGGWIIDRDYSGIDTGLEIQNNKGEQVNGHGGGQGGKYCTTDILNDLFTYYVDLVPNDNTTELGISFRCTDNPESGIGPGNYWEENADGFELHFVNAPAGKVDIRIARRVAGTKTFLTGFVAEDQSIPMRLGVDVSGSTCDIWSEPVGGGSRTTLETGRDLAENIGGSSDDFNDASHKRVGLVSASADNLSTFDEISVLVPNFPPSTPGAFTNPLEGNTYRDRLVAAWGPSTDPEDGTLQYEGQYSDDAGVSWSSLFSLQGGLSYTWDISGLTEGTQYQVRVRAHDGTDYSDAWRESDVFYISAPQPDAGTPDVSGGCTA